MIRTEYVPNIVDFAYQIIDMQRKINTLEDELDHEKKLNEINNESLKSSAEHGKNMIAIMLHGVLDPDSSINAGGRAIAELALIKEQS